MFRSLVLMPRLSDYMLNCLYKWQKKYKIELHIVHRRVNSNSPFNLKLAASDIYFYEREKINSIDLKKIASDINPDLIICFGWMDNTYLNILRGRRPGCRAVITMDNQWHGSFRQIAGLLWSRMHLLKVVDHIWVPGRRQRRFARMLGFRQGQIEEGLYVANRENFDPIWQSLGGGPPKRRLIFVGRYVREKGIEVLWAAFIEYCKQSQSELELWCIGTGPLEPTKPEHPQIRHLGFVQPAELRKILNGGGIFVLPSHFEPWGLVVQEFALAGCPLILSPSVGSSDVFLTDKNGILLNRVDVESLKSAFAYFDQLSSASLLEMSHVSRRLAVGLDTNDWISKAQAFMEESTKK